MIFTAMFLILLNLGPGATLNAVQTDSCHNLSYILSDGISYGMKLEDTCAGSAPKVDVDWKEDVDLVLGEPQSDEIKTGTNWVYVDSTVRPDLNKPATLLFRNHGFVALPKVLKDGLPCTEGTMCNLTFTPTLVAVDVLGFSNYSLTARQDFAVYSDPKPELKDKTYQTIDLGSSNSSRRAENYTCVVQIFGANDNAEWVLVQTNPTRDVQSKLFGSPDMNQPESLGYFPVKNGLANTYFRGDSLTGYNDFELVIQCASSSDLLIYEESISTRYSPAGRGITSRGVWFTDGANASYVMLYFFGGLIVLWVIALIIRRLLQR